MGGQRQRRLGGVLPALSVLELALAVAVVPVALALRFTERAWLIEAMTAASRGSDGFWVGAACASAWLLWALVVLVLNAVLRRLSGIDRLPTPLALPVFAALGGLAVLTAPNPRFPTAWDRTVDEALPRFFDGWVVGSLPLLVGGVGILLHRRLRAWRSRA